MKIVEILIWNYIDKTFSSEEKVWTVAQNVGRALFEESVGIRLEKLKETMWKSRTSRKWIWGSWEALRCASSWASFGFIDRFYPRAWQCKRSWDSGSEWIEKVTVIAFVDELWQELEKRLWGWCKFSGWGEEDALSLVESNKERVGLRAWCQGQMERVGSNAAVCLRRKGFERIISSSYYQCHSTGHVCWGKNARHDTLLNTGTLSWKSYQKDTQESAAFPRLSSYSWLSPRWWMHSQS